MGATQGSASYTTVHNFITAARNPLQCPAGVDVHHAIDNNQKIGRHSGRISEGSSVPMSICTSVSHILPSIPSYLQYDAALKHSNWLGTGEIMDNLALVEELEGSLLNVFRSYRGAFFEEICQEVFVK